MVKSIKSEPIVEKTGYLEENQPIVNDLDNPIIQSALKYIGVPYKWGATGNGAFDCSGFTRHVFREHGFELPRVSREQSKIGLNINNTDSLRPGDLIFFAGCKDLYNVHHVGIVKCKNEGNGKIMFIHASCSKGVTISSLSESYYRKRYLCSRRILNK